MVTNMMEIQCRLQSTVEALTCPLRKTNLRFLCAWLTQMHFSEDHTPAYNLSHLCFWDSPIWVHLYPLYCLHLRFFYQPGFISLSLFFFKHWLAINVTFLDTWCFAYAKQIPHYMIVMINKLISNSVKLNTLFFLGCGCLVNSAKQTNFELRLFSPTSFSWMRLEKEEYQDWRMQHMKSKPDAISFSFSGKTILWWSESFLKITFCFTANWPLDEFIGCWMDALLSQ